MADKINRIDVNLALLAQEDIKLLQGIADQLSSTLSGNGKRGFDYGQQRTRTAGDGPQYEGDADLMRDGNNSAPAAGRTYHTRFLENMLGGGGKLTGGRYNPLKVVGGVQNIGRDVDALAMSALGLPNVISGFQRLSPFGMMRGIGNVSYGANLGYSATNGLVPALSSAGQAGFMNQVIHPLGNMFNLNFSPGQARGVNEAITSFGYDPFGTGRGTAERRSLETLTKQFGNAIPASQMAAMLDPARYGGSSVGGLTAQIKMLGDVAQATNTTLSHSSEALQQMGQQIAQQLGTSAQAAQGQLISSSFATGFSPEVAGKPMTNRLIQGMMIGQSGGNVYNAFWGKNAGMNSIKAVERIVSQIAGVNGFDGLKQALHGPQKNAILNRLATAYWANPDIFGGYNPEQLVTLAERGDAKIQAGYKVGTDIQSALMSGENGHGGPSLSNLYQEARQAGVSHDAIKKIMSSGKDYHDKVVDLSSAVGKASKIGGQNQAGRAYIDLTDRAARILQKIVPDSSSSDANTYNVGGYRPSTYARFTK